MGKHNKRWGRLDENNRFVEFTFDDPKGRFHPSLIWVEVDPTTQYGSTLTLFGSVEAPPDTRDVRGDNKTTGVTDQVIKDLELTEDNDKSLHEWWTETKTKEKEEETGFTAIIPE